MPKLQRKSRPGNPWLEKDKETSKNRERSKNFYEMNPAIGNLLKNYISISAGKSKPRFKQNNKQLKQRIKPAFELLKNCTLCERGCKVDRTRNELGFCKVSDKIKISSIFNHYGEESFLVPSLTVFFWSCNLACEFCQNYELSQRIEPGIEVTEKDVVRAIDKTSCRNVNFVGGEPTPYLPFILKTLSLVKKDLPVVWNSNMYLSEKGMALLRGMVDVYLTDWKYFNDRCALTLSKAPNYLKIIKRNHLLAFKDSTLVIRHLVLPGHFKCCTRPLLDYLAREYGKKVVINLMDQYRPCYNAYKHPNLDKPLSQKEYQKVVYYADKLGLVFLE